MISLVSQSWRFSLVWVSFGTHWRGGRVAPHLVGRGKKGGNFCRGAVACLHSDWVMLAAWLKLHLECSVLQAGCTKKRDFFWNVSLLSRPHGPRCNSQRFPVKFHSFSSLDILTLLEMHAGPTVNIFTLPHPNVPSNPYSSACSEHCLQYFVLNKGKR